MLRISVLGSGSGGNSAVVFTERTRLLIDAGLSARQLRRRLEMVGVEPESLDGILITHEHGDHVRGLDVFCRTAKVPLYSNAATREVMVTGPLQEPKTWRLVTTGGKFVIGDIAVQTFPVAHDATEPMGFTLRDDESAIGVLSDVGYVTNIMRNHMRGMDTLFVEANYDGLLLQNDVKRPWSIKQRILSRHGHLSNEQTAAFLHDIADEGLQRVILGHLSRDCNTPEMATNTVREALRLRSCADVPVMCASQGEPTPCMDARRVKRVLVSLGAVTGIPAEKGEGRLSVEESLKDATMDVPKESCQGERDHEAGRSEDKAVARSGNAVEVSPREALAGSGRAVAEVLRSPARARHRVAAYEQADLFSGG